ncbi:MAG: S-layer homology domain-containing protein, partial [Clostridiales Family XIII bacterium]|nr:S-layer homology domain-containing protein [Clostridiales Family XIII bacterium]
MTKIGNTPLRALFGAILLFAGLAAASVPAFAASSSSLTVPAGAKEFTVEILLNENASFGGAEFGFTVDGGAGVKPVKYEKSTALSGAMSVAPGDGGLVFEGGRYLFGFASTSNGYSGRVNAGTLTFSYEGDAPHRISFAHLKLGRFEGENAVGELRDGEYLVIDVTREGAGEEPDNPSNLDNPNTPDIPSNPNIPSNPSSSRGGGGGGAPSTAVTVEIGEDATPLATGDAGRSKYFDDVAAGYAWAGKEIDALYERGVVKGVSARAFNPAGNVTRGDFTLMFVRAFGLEAEFTDNVPDVPKGKYYYEAIGTAKALGVAEGYGTAEFRPGAQISRQDMATLVYRAMRAVGKPFDEGTAADTAAFADSGDVAGYAEAAVRTLVKAGVLRGADGNLNPKGYATRAETAMIVYRLLDEN